MLNRKFIWFFTNASSVDSLSSDLIYFALREALLPTFSHIFIWLYSILFFSWVSAEWMNRKELNNCPENAVFD